ncbi:MAG TPA: lysophospholipid acyltransferase family protein [Candidatus Cloacimonetes bacterium]|nr:lysophospholipid acyltransferase family protein [Candidatus Cloacimonadota bacterium]
MKDKWWFSSYSFLAAGLLKLLKKTLRFEVFNQPEKEPVIYAFWHRNLMYCTLLRAGDPIAVIVSASKDGDLISAPVGRLGYHIVRGSSSRRGSQALKGLVRAAKEYSIAITPDGPRGPVGTVHPGMFTLALLAKIPIVAVHVDAKYEWVFSSWDRFRFPMPFAKAKVYYSDPIHVNSKDDIPIAEEQYRAFLLEKEKENTLS